MLRLDFILPLIGLVACSQVPQFVEKPIQPVKQESPKEVQIPSDPECNRKYQNVTRALFDTCIKEGMTYIQVSTMIGTEGVSNTQSGNAQIYQWSNGSGGFIIVMFDKDRVVSKSQGGFPAY